VIIQPAPLCETCIAAQNKWRDSKPSQVLPVSASFAYGSGAPHDVTIPAIRSRSADRYERWRRLVKESVKDIAASCRTGNHAPKSEDDE
jgi:hypothetical protein